MFLATKHGVEAKNYEGLGDAAKLKPLEVELKRLEDLSESIVQDFAHMRQREVRFGSGFVLYLVWDLFPSLHLQEEMRDTNESTNSRVLYFSLFSMCCLLGLATWQVGVIGIIITSSIIIFQYHHINIDLKIIPSIVSFSMTKSTTNITNASALQVLYLRKFFKSKKLIE